MPMSGLQHLDGEPTATARRGSIFGSKAPSRPAHQHEHKPFDAATQTESTSSPVTSPLRVGVKHPLTPDAIALLRLNNCPKAVKPTDGEREDHHAKFRLISELLLAHVTGQQDSGLDVDSRVARALTLAQSCVTDAEACSADRSATPTALLVSRASDHDDGASSRWVHTRHRSEDGEGGADDALQPGLATREGAGSPLSSEEEEEEEADAQAAQDDQQGDDRERCAALRQQLLTMQEQLRQRALAQYDINRNAVAALERSLGQLHATAEAAAAGCPAPPPAAAAGAAARPARGADAAADDAPAASLAALARQRDALGAQVARLQRQCSGLLAYVSLLSASGSGAGGAAAHAAAAGSGNVAAARLWVSLEATQQRQAPAEPRPESVRVRLLLLPAEGQQPEAAGATPEADDGTCSEDSWQAAEAERAVRVRVKLTVIRGSAAPMRQLPPQAYDHPAESAAGPERRAANGDLQAQERAHEGPRTAALHPRCDSQVAAPAHAGPIPSLPRLQQQQVEQPHQALEDGGEGGLPGALARLTAAVEDAMTAAATTSGETSALSTDGAAALTPNVAVTRATLDGLRGLLRQLQASGDRGPMLSAPIAPTTHAPVAAPGLDGNSLLSASNARLRQAPEGGDTAEARALAALPADLAQAGGAGGAAGRDTGDADSKAFTLRKRCQSTPVLCRDPDADVEDDLAEPRTAGAGGTDNGAGAASASRILPRVPTPPCSPRSFPASPAASLGAEHDADADPDHDAAASGRGSSSWAAAACGFDHDHDGWDHDHGDEHAHGHEHDEHMWEAGSVSERAAAEAGGEVEWEELAASAAAGGCGCKPLMAAVGFLRQQLTLANMEIVALNTQLGRLADQREGLQARASVHDAALQQLAINEGEARLEADRLRGQLEAERAARSRLSAKCEELQSRLLAGLSQGLAQHNANQGQGHHCHAVGGPSPHPLGSPMALRRPASSASQHHQNQAHLLSSGSLAPTPHTGSTAPAAPSAAFVGSLERPSSMAAVMSSLRDLQKRREQEEAVERREQRAAVRQQRPCSVPHQRPPRGGSVVAGCAGRSAALVPALGSATTASGRW